MAIISLRAYNREIESYIERGQYEQAIFHCRHILQYFPKHIDTYRLLGKTYLESQRYGDAADILQRVLSSVPDDFVSHVGLSIIREDEGNINDAIWHMERAFETQPSNSAIQSELRRLRQKRDGYDTPKVRLTRGALARMYMKGDLYPQAINELRAALSEDPKRIDLQILLGQCYLQVDKRVEAAETCSIVLHKLPNALEANRILEQILSTTERSEEARACRERVTSLDPYYAHTTSVRPDTAQVPDDAVVLEKANWQPGRAPGLMASQPDWAASLGVKVDELSPAQQDIPDWLSNAAPTTQPPESSEQEQETEPPTPSAEQEEDLIPDWLKDAGWGPSDGEVEAALEAEAPPPELENLPAVQADIPDWLQAIAPASEFDEDKALQDDTGGSQNLDWLSESEPSPGGDLFEISADTTSPEAVLDLGDVQQPLEVPEWLKGLGDASAQSEEPITEAETPAAENIPDWLTDISPDEQPEQKLPEIADTVDAGGADQAESGALPSWLQELEPQADRTPDTAEGGLPGAQDEWTFEFEGRSPQDETEETMEFPDWLKSVTDDEVFGQKSAVSLGQIEPPELPEIEPAPIDEHPDWMSEIEQEYGLDKPAKADEVMENEKEVPEAIPPEQPIPSQESKPEQAPFSMEEDVDSAFAWLESLAAKQGAREDELLLSPDERKDLPPDWLSGIEPEQETLPATMPPQVSPGVTAHLEFPDEESDETSREELPQWMKDIQPEKVSDATLPASTPAFTEADLEAELAEMGESLPPSAEPPLEAKPAEIPDWLAELEAEVETETPLAGEIPEPLTSAPHEPFEPEAAGPAEQATEAEPTALADWLRAVEGEALPVEQELPEPLEAFAETQSEAELAEAQPGEIPDWLRDLEATALPAVPEAEGEPQSEAGLPEAETAQLPDWLRELEAEQAPEAKHPAHAEESEAELPPLPSWISEEAGEPSVQVEPLAWPEEPEIIEGDTRPSTGKLRQLQEETPSPTGDLFTPAETQAEPEPAELPGWLTEMAQEAQLGEEPVQEISAAEDLAPALEIPEEKAEVLPDVFEEEAPALPEIFAEETPLPEPPPAIESLEALESPADLQQPAAETELVDEEAAFAWLESLAAKQGAKEEELLLEPEERAERPPDWLKKVLDTGELTPPETTEPGLPAFIEERAGASAELAPELQAETEEPVLTEEVAAEIPEEDLAGSVDEGLVAQELQQEQYIPFEEPVTEAEGLAAETLEAEAEPLSELEETTEAIPELPSWLQGLEEERSPEEATLALEEEGVAPGMAEFEAVDLNTASLRELERLPGVGFIRAQALIAYREANGPFLNVNELSMVEGFDADTIEGLMSRVRVEAPAPAVQAAPPPITAVTSDQAQETLFQARTELAQHHTQSALQNYLSLIESEQLLDEVIHDLSEALEGAPQDIDLLQALGDANLRAGHIQAALDAYIQAEKLLR